jgi:hypothetical protein
VILLVEVGEAVMVEDKRSLVEALKAELAFIENGGYRRLSWRPQFVFEDSPTCLNYRDHEHRRPCSECVLMQLVPEGCRDKAVPCRHISLNAENETLSSMYHWADEEEIEAAVTTWLKHMIAKLEQEQIRNRVAATGA